MSRIGNKPVPVPSGVAVSIEGDGVSVKGPQGELRWALPRTISATVRDGAICLTRADDTKISRRDHGLARSLVANMVEGVEKGFRRDLELQGVGFRASVQGSKLTMTLGYSSPVEFTIPDGIQVTVKDSVISVTGPDKKQVGEAAARIRSFYPPEPYKGKGVRYVGERVRRKAGKTVA